MADQPKVNAGDELNDTELESVSGGGGLDKLSADEILKSLKGKEKTGDLKKEIKQLEQLLHSGKLDKADTLAAEKELSFLEKEYKHDKDRNDPLKPPSWSTIKNKP